MPDDLTNGSYTGREIGPADLLRSLLRRKMWVAACVAAFLAVGVAYIILMPPVYVASARLQLGQVAAGQALEAPDVLSTRLLAQSGEEMATGVRRDRPFLKRVSTSRGASSTVELVAEAYSPDAAVEFVQRVADDIRRLHGEGYDRHAQSLAERLASLDKQREQIRGHDEEITSLVETLRTTEPIQAALLIQERSRALALLSELNAERLDIARRLLPPEMQRTELLGEIVRPGQADAPKKGLVIAFALILGLMAGVVMVLAAEIVASARRLSA